MWVQLSTRTLPCTNFSNFLIFYCLWHQPSRCHCHNENNRRLWELKFAISPPPSPAQALAYCWDAHRLIDNLRGWEDFIFFGTRQWHYIDFWLFVVWPDVLFYLNGEIEIIGEIAYNLKTAAHIQASWVFHESYYLSMNYELAWILSWFYESQWWQVHISQARGGSIQIYVPSMNLVELSKL